MNHDENFALVVPSACGANSLKNRPRTRTRPRPRSRGQASTVTPIHRKPNSAPLVPEPNTLAIRVRVPGRKKIQPVTVWNNAGNPMVQLNVERLSTPIESRSFLLHAQSTCNRLVRARFPSE